MVFKYKHLYECQDSTIEHKEPKDNKNVSHFIEAAGDIFRELTLEQPDNIYIREKIKKLDKFKELKSGDILELKNNWKRPEYKVELLDYLRKVNHLVDELDKTDFGKDFNRKLQLLRSLVVIVTVIDFGMFGSLKAEDDIERLKESLKEFL